MTDSRADRDTLVSVVVPIYKEEKNVRPLLERLHGTFEALGVRWEVVFAMDPSPDRTRDVIVELSEEGFPVRLVRFSRRIGKPLSLMAGLEHACGDAVVVLDADLQDPPELIGTMLEKWREGAMAVLARRRSRSGENPLYLACTAVFYRLQEWISEAPVPRDTGDFRLLDSRVVREICRFRERHGFLRGIHALVGFPTEVVYFDRDPRHSGRAQIRFSGAIDIALDGIVPFSRTPLRLIFLVGLFYVLSAKIIGLIWLIYGISAGFSDRWVSELTPIVVLGMGGFLGASVGVLGEYLVRAYEEVKDRPRYIVEELYESPYLMRSASTARCGPAMEDTP